MKKRISLILLSMALLFTAMTATVYATVTSDSVTADDIEVLRGYDGDNAVSFSGNKINLNGSGVVSAAQYVAIDAAKIATTQSNIKFTVTFNEDYTSLSGTSGDANYYENYRFAFGLMDERAFQGDNSGHGLGLELRLWSAAGNVRAMGFCYDGASTTSMQYPGRNLSSGIATASKGTSVAVQINSSSNGTWSIWIDSNDADSAVDKNVATFVSTDAGYPTDLMSGDKLYLVFGSYNADADMNVSISIDSVDNAFSLVDEIGASRYGENIALEDNILTRFYVEYDEALLTSGAKVELKLGDTTKTYAAITDGKLLEGTTNVYYYTMPVAAKQGADDITITVTAANGKYVTWSTSVVDYCTVLKAETEDTALDTLCDSVISYCNAAAAYFAAQNAN
ncbi:MAG: hypothetical protein IJW55_03915 [Clostridia bacterium]|nr:hypothetical protein [Clostridia bacterium]